MTNPEKVRRWFYLEWQKRNGTPYPQEPEKDNTQAVKILNHHRDHSIKAPWTEFVKSVVEAYFALDDKLLVGDQYPMRFIGLKLPAILSAIKVS